MSKFDTSGWKEFKIGDIFDIQTGSLLNSKELKNGDIKRISAKNENNGIIGSYDTLSISQARHYENFISVNFFGDTFYHPYMASVEMKVHILKLKNTNFTQESGIFIASILKRYFADKFGYGNQLSSSKLKNENFTIKLPIDKFGNLDFEYMETTIKNTKFQMQNILNTYKSLIQRERESKIWNLDFSSNSILSDKERLFIWGGIMQIATHLLKNLNCEWKEFNLTDLFDIVLAKGDLQPKKLEKGNIPLVSAGNFNNGIAMYINGGDGISEKFDKNCISVDMFGKAFYQNNDFYAVSHGRVNILLPKFELNKFIAMFFIAILNSKLFGKYSFSTMCSQSKLTKEKISLPIDKFSNPNFEIMEKFIKEIEKNHTSKLLAYYRHITTMGGGISKFEISDYLKFNANFDDKKILWREFKVGDIFEILTPKKKFNAVALEFGGKFPYVVRSDKNNGIRGYIDENPKYLNDENTISFGQDTATMFFQKDKYFTGDKIKIFKFRFGKLDENIATFIIVCLKSSFASFGWGSSSYNVKILKDIVVKLPIYENGEIAFEFMENYILNLKNQTSKFIQSSKNL